MPAQLFAWDDVAGIEARDRWHALEPRLTRLEQAIVDASEHAEDEITHELSEVRAALRRLRHEVLPRARRFHGELVEETPA